MQNADILNDSCKYSRLWVHAWSSGLWEWERKEGGLFCLFIYFVIGFRGFVHLGAGLAVGLSGLAAGFAIGIVGDAGVRGTAQQPRLFVGMILILIFAEVLGLYGLIVAIYFYSKQ